MQYCILSKQKHSYKIFINCSFNYNFRKMKPTLVADEMFPDGAGSYIELEEVGGSRLLVDLTASEKAVHADFFNDFDDLYDDDDLE
ncbi:COP9 signalosome complex subunit 9 isoform X1 [Osmia lignaria lignaria]|uniref:COP9 signalosome complex subunit 9 isoform X1 n=2 Tax=Megachilinae TaxID=156330 RepID=UPI00147874FF|nr:COP9 signalosome complex subunit 9 isoform X1 [Osmia lignaria]